ncbi:MAG: hypothetical protein QW655_03445 [Nitrososphaerota archaeon]|nr:hypothetical protein [Candidatus Geocrenenecus dongiae]
MSNVRSCSLTLVCRFYGEEGGWRKIASTLNECGWITEGMYSRKDDVEVKCFAESNDRKEIILTLDMGRMDKILKIFRELVEALFRCCWYVDVYYHLRGSFAEKISEKFSVTDMEKVRKKIHGLEVLIEKKTNVNLLNISYRLSRDRVKSASKLHSEIIKEVIDVE